MKATGETYNLRAGDDTPRFGSPGALLRWLFAARRVKAQSAEGGGGHSDARSIGDRGLRIAFAAQCFAAVTDPWQVRLLELTHGEGFSETKISDLLHTPQRTVGRIIKRGEKIVRARAVELGVMEDR
jgi:hypothetical protein